MEELLIILIGGGLVALLPLVPGLRPVAKTAVKGGLVLKEKTKGGTNKLGQEWRDVVNEAKAETQAEQQTSSAVEPVAEDRAPVKVARGKTKRLPA